MVSCHCCKALTSQITFLYFILETLILYESYSIHGDSNEVSKHRPMRCCSHQENQSTGNNLMNVLVLLTAALIRLRSTPGRGHQSLPRIFCQLSLGLWPLLSHFRTIDARLEARTTLCHFPSSLAQDETHCCPSFHQSATSRQ